MKALLVIPALVPALLMAQEPAGTPIRRLELGRISIDVLVDATSAPGAGIEIGQIVFPAGTRGGGHVHRVSESFYILTGTLVQTVNGQTSRLEAGDIGVVLAGDTVSHAVPGEAEVRALIIMTPAGGLQELVDHFGFREEPHR